MKKVLFAAGLIALATSCSQDDLTSLATQKMDVKGITFVTESMPESRVQWDYISSENSYSPFWYAEQDRVSIYAVGVNSSWDSTNEEFTVVNTLGQNEIQWSELGSPVTYKATQSAQAGKFTAVSDADMLGFDGDKKAKFFAVYPSDVTATYDAATKNIVLTNLPTLHEQRQTGIKGQNKALMMYAEANNVKRTSDYSSVGETVGLKYEFPISAIGLRTANANKYTIAPTNGESVFGDLLNIEIQAKGYDKDGDGVYEEGDIKPSAISWDNEVAQMVVDTTKFEATVIAGTTDATTPVDTTKVVLELGYEWSDEALAMAAIRDVKRKNVFTAEKPETFTITYNFENISLSTPVESHKVVTIDFDGFITYPALDMNTFKYLVTNESEDGANDRTLIVNAGTFSEIFNEAGKVKWNEGTVELDDFNKIFVNNITLTADECKKIAGFSSLTEIELNENTSIPANTFSEAQAGQLTSIVMPKVTSIDTKFVADAEGKEFTALTNLNLHAYEFANDKVNKTFFNNTTKNCLLTLDMSGVVNMLPTFGIDRSLSFEGYALTEVTVQDGMKVAPKGFMNCAALETINGVVDLLNGDEAFKGAEVLETINVKSTVIPYGAFNGAKALENVLLDDEQVAPTAVGELAFYNTNLTYMDLSNLEAVGKNAFNNSNLTAPNKDTDIMEIGGETISFGAFANTNLKMVNFTEATVIENNVLKGTNLIHLKFTKAFEVDLVNTVWESPFGYTAGIDLFINPSQKYMSGTKMTLMKGTTKYEFTFKTVQKE